MNYLKHYHLLIEKADNRGLTKTIAKKKGIYGENHHIVPRCIGGSNDADNIVFLYPEEHYVAHQLLMKIYTNEPKVIFACYMMTVDRKDLDRSRNKEYKWIKEKRSNELKKMMTGKKFSKEHKENLKKSWTNERRKKAGERQKGENHYMFGKKHTESYKKKMSETLKIVAPFKGKKHSEETKEKIREKRKHQIFSEETKKKISENNTGEGNPMYGKKHSEETKEKIREKRLDAPKFQCPYCKKYFFMCHLKQHHLEKCKMFVGSPAELQEMIASMRI